MLRDRGGGGTHSRDVVSPDRGSDIELAGADLFNVGSAALPGALRLVIGASIALVVTAVLVVGSADAGASRWQGFLAPKGTCRSADDASASVQAQTRAITCLVNWARAHDRRGALVSRPALRRAAALKGHAVASCGDFSHTPCGTRMSAAVRKSGYRYTLLGENLFAGPWGSVTPREVVAAWLRSPPHRANVLAARFSELGIAPAHAPRLAGFGDAVVWTAAFAAPR